MFGLDAFYFPIHAKHRIVFLPAWRPEPLQKSLKTKNNGKSVLEWKSKGLSNEIIKPLTSWSHSFGGGKIRVKFDGSCSKQGNNIFTHGKVVNL